LEEEKQSRRRAEQAAPARGRVEEVVAASHTYTTELVRLPA